MVVVSQLRNYLNLPETFEMQTTFFLGIVCLLKLCIYDVVINCVKINKKRLWLH